MSQRLVDNKHNELIANLMEGTEDPDEVIPRKITMGKYPVRKRKLNLISL